MWILGLRGLTSEFSTGRFGYSPWLADEYSCRLKDRQSSPQLSVSCSRGQLVVRGQHS